MDYTDLYNFQTDTGIIVPKDSEILPQVQEKFKEIFGTDLDLSAETPVGRLIEAFTVLIRTALGVTAQSANQFNPNLSTGIYLDSIGEIYSLKRIVGSRTQIEVKCYFTSEEQNGVPAGSIIMSSTTGDMFTIDQTIVPEGTEVDEKGDERGVGIGTATATNVGPVPGDVGTVNIVQNAVLGWTGVTNTRVLRVGTNIETDDDFRKRIGEARSIGVGFLESLTGKLRRIDDVFSACIVENNDSETAFINGVPVPGHTIFVCAYTGSDNPSEKAVKAIADAIIAAKPVGTGILGDVDSVEIEGAKVHKYSVDVMGDSRYKTEIAFYTPAIVYVKATIKIYAGLYTGSQLESSVKAAACDYINSVDIGKSAYNTEMASSIIRAVSGINVLSIKLGIKDESEYDESGDFGPDRIVSYAFQKLVANHEDIEIEVV